MTGRPGDLTLYVHIPGGTIAVSVGILQPAIFIVLTATIILCCYCDDRRINERKEIIASLPVEMSDKSYMQENPDYGTNQKESCK